MSLVAGFAIIVILAFARLLYYWRWMWEMERGEGTRKLDRQRALIGFVILAVICLGWLAVRLSLWRRAW